jgi:hypothetical protein
MSHPLRRLGVTLGAAVAIAATLVAALAARPFAQAKTYKQGDLIVFRATSPPQLPSGGQGVSLLDFKLPAGSWLLGGRAVVVRGTSSSGPTELACTLLGTEANAELAARHQRSLELDASVKLVQPKAFQLRCRLGLAPNPAASATLVRVTALRVRSITVKTS